MCVSFTSTVTLLLVAAVHAVCVGVAAPADGNTVAVLTLELITVTLHITAVLQSTHTASTSSVDETCDPT